ASRRLPSSTSRTSPASARSRAATTAGHSDLRRKRPRLRHTAQHQVGGSVVPFEPVLLHERDQVGLGDVTLHRPAPIRQFPAEHPGGARATQNDTRGGQQLEQWLCAYEKTSFGGPATQAWEHLEQTLLA